VFRSLSPDESVIEGIPSASKFVVISDIERDADGFMWLINVLVGIAVVDGFPEQRGFLFRQTDFGLNPGVDLYRMAIAPDGLKWICSRTDGLILLDDGGTPFTAGDDRMLLLNSDFDSRLSSERAFDIVVNAEGVVWLATDSGVNSIHGRYSRDTGTFDVESWQVYNTFDGLPSNEINALESDDFGNVWVGTESGLTQIDGNRRVAFTLTASNSGLIDNRVKGLLYDRER
ncbi:uncharacterized protein METZ01_LOCUS514726, partial [marine metagenome]